MQGSRGGGGGGAQAHCCQLTFGPRATPEGRGMVPALLGAGQQGMTPHCFGGQAKLEAEQAAMEQELSSTGGGNGSGDAVRKDTAIEVPTGCNPMHCLTHYPFKKSRTD